MSLQNTIKCMKKYNHYAVRNNVREANNVQVNEEEEAVNREVVKQCVKLNEILYNMKNVNFENIEHFDAEETIHSPRILNLKQKKEELELKIKQHKPRKPKTPCTAERLKPVIPKIINSKIANINK